MISVRCPVCLDREDTSCTEQRGRGDYAVYHCKRCGYFDITRSAYVNAFREHHSTLNQAQRATLSHRLRLASDSGRPLRITSEWIDWFQENARLVNIREQASMLIGLIGDEASTTGRSYTLDPINVGVLIGAINSGHVRALVDELLERRLIRKEGPIEIENPYGNGVLVLSLLSLTFDGWDEYQKRQIGEASGKYGFVAMKFGDQVLDGMLQDHIKPLVSKSLGYELVNMHDVSQAGLIDNIMRTKIKGAAFVLADLTHDNYGAYWEAGYAEGLGKPVIYLCERKKFDAAKTHFDTNHCTTVMWDSEDKTSMNENLISTIKRSLDLG